MKTFEKFKRILKKKKTEEKAKAAAKVKTELEEICGDDKKTYEALLNTMFLYPGKIGTTMEEAAKKAKEFEKSGDLEKARTWYQMAGGLAIYKGNVKKVIQYFSQCQKLSPNKTYKILEIPEKAVAKAQEYYKKYLKPEEKK